MVLLLPAEREDDLLVRYDLDELPTGDWCSPPTSTR